MRYWRCNMCDYTEPLTPTDDDWESYKVGDTEPCIECCDLNAVCTLEEGTPVLDVVGHSPVGS